MVVSSTFIHIPTPEVYSFILAIAIIYSLGSFSLALHIKTKLLPGAGRYRFWEVHLFVLVLVVIWGLMAFDLRNLLISREFSYITIVITGVAFGFIAVYLDRFIVRKIFRKTTLRTNNNRTKAKKSLVERYRSRLTVEVKPLDAIDKKGIETPLHINKNTRETLVNLFVILGIAILEEILYRGYLVQASLMLDNIYLIAIALSASVLAFSLAHIQFGWAHVFGKLPLGILALASVLVLGSIVSAIIIHCLFNYIVWKESEGELSNNF